MSDQTLTCPQCGNTSPPQPIGTVWCWRVDKHPRKYYVQMTETKEETKWVTD